MGEDGEEIVGDDSDDFVVQRRDVKCRSSCDVGACALQRCRERGTAQVEYNDAVTRCFSVSSL